MYIKSFHSVCPRNSKWAVNINITFPYLMEPVFIIEFECNDTWVQIHKSGIECIDHSKNETWKEGVTKLLLNAWDNLPEENKRNVGKVGIRKWLEHWYDHLDYENHCHIGIN